MIALTGIMAGSRRRMLTLPDGAAGVWYADQLVTSPRRYIPNAVSPTAPASLSVFNAGRRLLSSSSLYSPIGCTITDRFAAGHDGQGDSATRISGGGGCYVQSATVTLGAGAWSVWAWVKSNTGAAQDLKSTGGGLTITFTATTVWQRLQVHQWNSGGDRVLFGFQASDGAADVDILVSDIDWFAGIADLGTATLAGHMYLGVSDPETATAAASGSVTFGADGFALAQFPASVTLDNALTVIYVGSQILDTNDYPLAVRDPAGAFQCWLAFNRQTLGWEFNSIRAQEQQDPSLLFYGKGNHAFTMRYDGAALDTFVDDVSWTHKASVSAGSVAFKDLVFGRAGGNRTNFTMHACAVFDRALTDAEVRQAHSFLAARAVAEGDITLSRMDRVLCAEGDSITAPYIGGELQSYAYKYGANASPFAYTLVRAHAGDRIADLVARAASVDAAIPPDRAGRTFILSVLIGANDQFAGMSTADFLAALAAYLDARRAVWDKVVLCTILPSTAAGFNAWRGTVNTALRTWVGTHCDAICDFAANATVGTDAAASDSAKFSDGTHPTDATQVVLEADYRPVLNAL